MFFKHTFSVDNFWSLFAENVFLKKTTFFAQGSCWRPKTKKKGIFSINPIPNSARVTLLWHWKLFRVDTWPKMTIKHKTQHTDQILSSVWISYDVCVTSFISFRNKQVKPARLKVQYSLFIFRKWITKNKRNHSWNGDNTVKQVIFE